MAAGSAVIVPVPLPPELLALRERADRMAARGVPPHVTVLFPFLPVAALTPEVHVILAGVAAMQQPFVARFDHVERRGQMIWLVPADQQPFLRLAAEVAVRWPDFPPYGGAHDELIAHLTLVETDDAASVAAARVLALEAGSFDTSLTELRVIVEDEAGSWHAHWRLALGSAGGGPRQRS